MTSEKILKEKDRVQEELWKEAGRGIRAYTKLVHKKAEELKRSGTKLKYAS